MKYVPAKYQELAEDFVLSRPSSGLFLDMGLGKTVIALSAAERLLRDYFQVRKVLVVAPLLPAKDVWPAEIEKWDHLKDLTWSLVTGDQKTREAALAKDADIYIINREMVVWLVEYYKKRWPFDMVIVDELSSFKSSKSQRFRALKKVRKYIEVFIGLTGTPAPNGLLDLWSQVYLLDSGEALGRTLTSYRETYFHPGQRGPQGVVYNWRPNPGAEKLIYDRLAGLCLSMQNAVDLPDRVMVDKVISMDSKTEELYRKLESDYLLPFAGGDIDAATAAILANKLLQFSGGAVYDENGGVREIHSLKLDALDSLIEEANGSPVLVFYNYVHEKDRILARHPEAVWIKEAGAVERWNRGEIPLLLANPASAGHGLNLQAGGHIAVWFSPTWNLEYYEQANKRLHRRGQTETVTIQHIIVKGTIDEKITRCVLKNKKACQDSLLEAVRAQIKEAVND